MDADRTEFLPSVGKIVDILNGKRRKLYICGAFVYKIA
jgi:hypothetical protein